MYYSELMGFYSTSGAVGSTKAAITTKKGRIYFSGDISEGIATSVVAAVEMLFPLQIFVSPAPNFRVISIFVI